MSGIRTTKVTSNQVPRPPVEPRMMRHGALAVVGVCAILVLSGCAAIIADGEARGPERALRGVRYGATRKQVERGLGSPLSSRTLPEGSRADIYEYRVPKEGGEDRSHLHFWMYLLTMGGWDLVAVPYELLSGEKRWIEVTYGPNGRVTALDALEKLPHAVISPAVPSEGMLEEWSH